LQQDLLVGEAGQEEEERDHPDADEEGGDGAGAEAQGDTRQQICFEAGALVVKQAVQVSVRKIGEPENFVDECSNCKRNQVSWLQVGFEFA